MENEPDDKKPIKAEIFDFNKLKEKWKNGKTPDLIPPPETFEVGKLYNFDPAVKSMAYYDESMTDKNEIGFKLFNDGKCLKYLGQTSMGPRFLFSSILTGDENVLLKDMTIYFGVIYNKTDPERSHAI